MSEIGKYLRALFAQKPEGSWICIWRFPQKQSAWFQTVEAAEAYVLAHAGQDIYAELGASPKDYGPDHRCKAGDVVGVAGLWTDIDHAGPGAAHQKKNLPPSFEAALSILPPEFPPSLIVNSGHGLHAYWLFKEYEEFADEAERDRVATVVKRWERFLLLRAQSKGWTIDAVHDLARILRIPGTTNAKIADAPVRASIHAETDRRYNLSEFEEFVEGVPLVDGPNIVPIVRRSFTTKEAGGLLIDPMRGLNPEKLALFIENDLKFANTWRHQRPDLPEQSQSAYDMAIGNLLYEAGCTNQEIADALIQNRREAGAKSKLRTDYYQRTISRIHTKIRPGGHLPEEAVQTLETNSGPATLAPIHDSAATEIQGLDPVLLKQVICESLSATLGIFFKHPETGEMVPGITRIVKYTGSKPHWRIELRDGGYVAFTSGAQFEQFNLFARRMWEAATIEIEAEFNKEKWKAVRRSITSALVNVDGGPDNDERSLARVLLDSYLADQGVVESKDEVFAAKSGMERPFKYKGQIAVSSIDLRRYAQRQFDIHKDLQEFGSALSAIGATNKIFHTRAGRSTQSRWLLPKEFVASVYQELETTGRLTRPSSRPPLRATEEEEPEK